MGVVTCQRYFNRPNVISWTMTVLNINNMYITTIADSYMSK